MIQLIKKTASLLLILIVIQACSYKDNPATLAEGAWLGMLTLNDSNKTNPITMPFRMEVSASTAGYIIRLQNADEKVDVESVSIIKDSIFVKFHVFDTELKGVIKDGMISGNWINHSRKDKNVLPFVAYPGLQERFKNHEITPEDFSGKWEADFSGGTPDSYKAVGIFKQEGATITGTFLTETGDYRYLEGTIDGNTAYLSSFDGGRAFLFSLRKEKDATLSGSFWSGAHHYEPWIAKRNEFFELTSPDSLTLMKPGYERLDFSFPNLEHQPVSLSDEKYKNKVVIVQITGSWCPNCMDETAFLAPLYDQYKNKGLEIVALAFERTTDFDKAKQNVMRLKNRFNANYDFLITGLTGKDAAGEALPMLNKVMSFPTTIYIDKKGMVRKIYTGFNGPATGHYYTDFVEETTTFLTMLLAE